MAATSPSIFQPVVTRTISWQNLCQQMWGSEWRTPERGVYEFSNGRRFDSTDNTNSGIYNGGAK